MPLVPSHSHPLMRADQLDPTLPSPGAYAPEDLALVGDGFKLWESGAIALAPAETVRRMALLLTVNDGEHYTGIKYDGEEYCSCHSPRRCAHLWALTFALQCQRPHVKRKPGTSKLLPRPSPLSVRSLVRAVSGPRREVAIPPDPIASESWGLGVVQLLGRSGAFIETLKRVFADTPIETLTVSYLFQFLQNIANGLVGDYWNLLTALQLDNVLAGAPPDPTELVRSILLHCDTQARGSSLGELLRHTTEASVRCVICNAQSWGRTTYDHWRQSVYPWSAGSSSAPTDRSSSSNGNTSSTSRTSSSGSDLSSYASTSSSPSLDLLLQSALFDGTELHCGRCEEETQHIVRHTPLGFGELLLIRVAASRERPASPFSIPAHLIDRPTGARWRLLGYLTWVPNRSRWGEYKVFVAHGEGVVGLDHYGQKVRRAVDGRPVCVLYERDR